MVLDTSFVVRALVETEVGHDEAGAFLKRLTSSRSFVLYSALLEIELAEAAFKIAIKERHGNRAWPMKRSDGRVRRRAARVADELIHRWRTAVGPSPSTSINLASVTDPAFQLMRRYGLGSYDAVHAATVAYTGATALVTNDVGFAAVPAGELRLLVDESRLDAARRRRATAGPGGSVAA
ncbi:type II toxin-antitoxin system VapC family toxin [Curtobacterium sp. PhB130]|uniref:type II toxin-antitoxin system VapC family toxin n=1 Tax=Curtobacterium sp. PhB130 TaxID=2485178 RepID=UPI0021A40742|nr:MULTISPECIES: type II toxin-antitoxin system VapC family toxin [unclassified Curtobacterium]